MAEINATYPAGKYYIGDVCYALDDKVYQKQWGECHKFAVGTHVMSYNGIQNAFTVNHTVNGDGTYLDERSKLEYSVDSGTIGIVPYDLCSVKNINNNEIVGGHFIESTTSVEFYSQNGIFVIGYNNNRDMIIIDTNWFAGEDEEK